MLSNINTDIVSKTQAELHVYADGTLGNDANSGLQEHAGTGGSLSVTAGVVTFTVGSGTPFLIADVGKLITIDYATSPDNNGSFLVTGVPASNQVTYANAFGVTETLPAGGKWALSSPKQTLQAVCNLVPLDVEHHVCIHLSGVFNEQGAAILEKVVARDRVLLVDGGMGSTMMSALSGTGDSFAKSGSTITLTDAGANFTSNLVGKTIYIQDVVSYNALTSITNGGAFTITAVLGPTQIQWTNANGVGPEAFTGRWTIVPFDTTRSGTGDNLTFGGGNVTLVDAGASFTQDDVGKQIVISGSTTPANDGTFIVASVVSSTSVVFANAAGVTEAFTGTWVLGNYVADSASSSHIGLTTAGWGKDQYEALKLEILTGPAAGQTRTIHANDVSETSSTIPTGTGNALSVSGGVVTLTCSGASFLTSMIGSSVVIAGATTGANNGTFTITDVPSKDRLRWVNASGVSEAFPGTWTLTRSFTSGSPVTLTDYATEWSPRLVGKKITITGSTSPANNGTFTVLSVPTPHTLTYTNGAAVTENFAGTWTTENGWITPTRNFSISPGVGAQFRIVRPKTTLRSSTAQSDFKVKNVGNGTMALQGLYTDGSKVQIFCQGTSGTAYFADLVLGSTISTKFSAIGMTAPTFEGVRYSPTTFAQLTLATDHHCGLTDLAPPVSANIAVNMRSSGVSIIRAMVLRSLALMRQNDHSTLSQGCRFGSVVFMNNTWLQFGASVQNTTGYAVTRFGGHGYHKDFALPGVVVTWTASQHINAGVEISDCFSHAVEVQHSFLRMTASPTGAIVGIKNRGFGCYCWFNSQLSWGQRIDGSTLLTGMATGALGDITVDGVNPIHTWNSIKTGTPLVSAEQMVLGQKAYHIY